jgi:hypothetical protein
VYNTRPKNDQKQKEDFAIWNLQFSCRSNDQEDSNWAFELLSKNKDYLKEIKKKKKYCRKHVAKLSKIHMRKMKITATNL